MLVGLLASGANCRVLEQIVYAELSDFERFFLGCRAGYLRLEQAKILQKLQVVIQLRRVRARQVRLEMESVAFDANTTFLLEKVQVLLEPRHSTQRLAELIAFPESDQDHDQIPASDGWHCVLPR